MASLSVRNLNDESLARLKRRAARHGRSTPADARIERRRAGTIAASR
jgi:plasmid stability protein